MQVLFGLGLPMEGEVSMTLGYVLKCNYLLPYNSENGTGSRQNNIAAKRVSKVSRWSLYRMLEAAIDRGCLLRVICEAAALPFFRPGLLGQLLQAFLTPTMTDEEYEMYTDRQYHKAEASGRDQDCRHFYRDCPYSPLDHFTRYIDT
ncbi:PREDICTED: uncharacterized protein LOC105363171 [Ceratosolen solmsi marchali]|uniref:Uncharacterized protein LOC105363171 n=1 Tax=Ceratosolen solmsi marchali TaxID=326594 RepID=A0AAJ7DWL4_9HYME|nr:PREDICTED: uncharacterized protein LOC105363171 [Ceratosolen solmsi marchali]